MDEKNKKVKTLVVFWLTVNLFRYIIVIQTRNGSGFKAVRVNVSLMPVGKISRIGKKTNCVRAINIRLKSRKNKGRAPFACNASENVLNCE